MSTLTIMMKARKITTKLNNKPSTKNSWKKKRKKRSDKLRDRPDVPSNKYKAKEREASVTLVIMRAERNMKVVVAAARAAKADPEIRPEETKGNNLLSLRSLRILKPIQKKITSTKTCDLDAQQVMEVDYFGRIFNLLIPDAPVGEWDRYDLILQVRRPPFPSRPCPPGASTRAEAPSLVHRIMRTDNIGG